MNINRPKRTMSHSTPKPKRVATYTRVAPIHPPLSRVQQLAVIRKYAKRYNLKIEMKYSVGAKGGGRV